MGRKGRSGQAARRTGGTPRARSARAPASRGAGTVTVYATAGSPEEARRIALHLLETRLVACANLFPIDSLYRWKGKVEEARETAMLLKTTRALAPRAVAALAAAHPYDVPCAVVWEHDGGFGPYRAWIREETGP